MKAKLTRRSFLRTLGGMVAACTVAPMLPVSVEAKALMRVAADPFSLDVVNAMTYRFLGESGLYLSENTRRHYFVKAASCLTRYKETHPS